MFQWCSQGGKGMSGLLQRDLRYPQHHSNSGIYFTLSIRSIFSYIRAHHWSPVSSLGESGYSQDMIPPHPMWTHHVGQEDSHPILPVPPQHCRGCRTVLAEDSTPEGLFANLIPAFGPPAKKKSKILLREVFKLKKFEEHFHF